MEQIMRFIAKYFVCFIFGLAIGDEHSWQFWAWLVAFLISLAIRDWIIRYDMITSFLEAEQRRPLETDKP